MYPEDLIFDTRVDTNNIFVSLKTKVVRRPYLNKEGLSPLYLHVTGKNERERINLDIQVYPNEWHAASSRLKGSGKHGEDINLILDHIEAKASAIKISYRLANRDLNVREFKNEFINGIPRVDFFPFAEQHAEKMFSGKIISAGTFQRYKSVLNKLKKFEDRILFSQIDLRFLDRLRSWLGKKNNQSTTIESNISVLKTFLCAAHKHGIRFPLQIEDIKVGSTSGDRTDLKPTEVLHLLKYYESPFINSNNKLILGYFLFACFNGLRISEIQGLKRSQFSDTYYEFYSKKTKRTMRRKINATTNHILLQNPHLFVEKFTDPALNRGIKEIFLSCGIKKRISFHSARHTFATNFLRMGGDVVSLQQLLGHSDIKTTMIYVHIINSEANEKVDLMDKLLYG